jgi:hypothetical protein
MLSDRCGNMCSKGSERTLMSRLDSEYMARLTPEEQEAERRVMFMAAAEAERLRTGDVNEPNELGDALVRWSSAEDDYERQRRQQANQLPAPQRKRALEMIRRGRLIHRLQPAAPSTGPRSAPRPRARRPHSVARRSTRAAQRDGPPEPGDEPDDDLGPAPSRAPWHALARRRLRQLTLLLRRDDDASNASQAPTPNPGREGR